MVSAFSSALETSEDGKAAASYGRLQGEVGDQVVGRQEPDMQGGMGRKERDSLDRKAGTHGLEERDSWATQNETHGPEIKES